MTQSPIALERPILKAASYSFLPAMTAAITLAFTLTLVGCASKQNEFDLDTAVARDSTTRTATEASAMRGDAAHLAQARANLRVARERRKIYVTRARDLAVRSEIDQEMAGLAQLEQARAKLHAEFRAKPLPGPITVKHLEDVLVAEFEANRLQAQYLANNREQADRHGVREDGLSDSILASVASLNTAPSADVERSIHSSGTPPLLIASNALITTTATARAGASNHRESTVVGSISIETHAEDGREPARKMATRVLQNAAFAGVAREPGMIAEARPLGIASLKETPAKILKRLNSLDNRGVELSQASETPLIFDIPMTYNARVSFWIRYFQTEGRTSFKGWLERSSKFIPLIQYELTRSGLPQDLVYLAMIESGFSTSASSHAAAIGLWQFIEPTGRRYGLKIDWWLDERRDFIKSTRAAINYMGDLYQQFNSWYLVAASYNMGENGVRRLTNRYKTNNFWELADRGVLPNETTNYVPKIIAATLIAKAPALYGFRDLNYQMPVAFEYYDAPGGTDISNLAQYLGVSHKYLRELNPELTKGFVPRGIGKHRIRIPKGALLTVSQYEKLQAGEDVTF